ncbi:MAG: hypothetical protein M1831_003331 [Alyxoria varia]|nr:MAG: hypothetical protein M1831_003331 [Alyxoria varia]
MSNPTRTLPSHLRASSFGVAGNASSGSSSRSGASPVLLARINEKKAELENLKELRDLSAQLAGQMQTLEEKLSTLSNGTEGMDSSPRQGTVMPTVAAVLSNWHNVLRAINMASMKIQKPKDDTSATQEDAEAEVPLPQTLVRIPAQDRPSGNPG